MAALQLASPPAAEPESARERSHVRLISRAPLSDKQRRMRALCVFTVALVLISLCIGIPYLRRAVPPPTLEAVTPDDALEAVTLDDELEDELGERETILPPQPPPPLSEPLPPPPLPPPRILARDGFGQPVDWFAIVKLPERTFPAAEVAALRARGVDAASDLNASTAHCACPDPSCSSSAAGADIGEGRGSGLCYLYADSNSPTLRPHVELGYDCLGQGGNDPLSHTLRQLHARHDDPDVEWAYWNDQLQGTADSYTTDVCKYSSYSADALPYTMCTADAECGKRCGRSASDYRACDADADCADGDSCEQIECAAMDLPHYYAGCGAPWAHSKGALAFERNATGFHLMATTPNYPDPSLGANGGEPPSLGCQLTDNVQFAQSFVGLSLDAKAFRDDLAPALARARLCSAGSGSCTHGTAGHVHEWNCTSEHTRGADWSVLDLAFSGAEPEGAEASASATLRTVSGHEVTLLAKAAADHVPPWYYVADALGVDLAVASWLDGQYGTPSICAADDFSGVADDMCLADASLGLALSPTGGAARSVENALAAAVDVGGERRAWGLWGDLWHDFTSHAKYAVASAGTAVVFGDENMQGWPCSSACDRSQNGRGGTFFALGDAALRASLAATMALVCACDGASAPTRRFCTFGCADANSSAWMPDVPAATQRASEWEAVAWGGG